MYHRGIIVVLYVMIVNGGDVGLLTWMCSVCDSLDPIKPMDVRVA